MPDKRFCNFKWERMRKNNKPINSRGRTQLLTNRPADGKSLVRKCWKPMEAIVNTMTLTNPLSANSFFNHVAGSMALNSTRKSVTARLSRKAKAIMNAKISAISAIVKCNMNDESLLKKPSSDQLWQKKAAALNTEIISLRCGKRLRINSRPSLAFLRLLASDQLNSLPWFQ